MMSIKYDIIVIGGGHAGIEAAYINAKLGNQVALVTLDKSKIGFMPCNPSVGGSAKGIVVREIDALGGLMGLAADATALQFKLLNSASGPAIQALRVQSDKVAYSRYMQKVISKQKNITIMEGGADSLLVENNSVIGVKLINQQNIYGKTVILTTGTYLQPITYKGKETNVEGPDGEKKVFNNISQQLQKWGFKLKRFKTGTSPRLCKDSIDYSRFKLEPGHDLPLKFSYRSQAADLLPFTQQLPCYLLHTNEKTHQLIRKNAHLSPIFYKKDLGVGPRYCPSIEHKVCLFSEKERHQIFLEPESRELATTYIQGLSTSLPIEIQAQILKTLPGLEKAQVQKWGYAIEYDVVDSTQLKISLETKLIDNLFTAGQINGTTAYEEAAAQGLMAGINANQKIKNLSPVVLGRDQAYIGVLLDDLVTKEISDPYRLLTSRAEYRLLLRHDNADTRLYPLAYQLGLLSAEQWEEFQQKQNLQELISQALKKTTFDSVANLQTNFPNLDTNQWKNRQKIKAYDLLKSSKLALTNLVKWIPAIKQLSWEAQRELEINLKYEGYIQRQKEEVEQMKKYESKLLPNNIDYNQVDNLALEAKEKLNKIKPISLGQARRIGGINPTDIQVLNYYLNKSYPQAKANLV